MKKRSIIRIARVRFRRLFTRENGFVAVCLALVIGIVGYGIMQSHTMIPPAAYTPLLNVIADGESRGNYNAYFGNAGNRKVVFTNMTLAEVLRWQAEYVAQGSPSNAVGRYQIIEPTLHGLVEKYKLDTSLRFDQTLQDKLAIALMEQRGSVEFIKQKISPEEFAHNLSKEWAALPTIIGETPERSYYAGDGLNESRVSPDQILSAIDEFKRAVEN